MGVHAEFFPGLDFFFEFGHVFSFDFIDFVTVPAEEVMMTADFFPAEFVGIAMDVAVDGKHFVHEREFLKGFKHAVDRYDVSLDLSFFEKIAHVVGRKRLVGLGEKFDDGFALFGDLEPASLSAFKAKAV